MSENFIVHIPKCCQEGWDTCEHVINKDTRKAKQNVGL